MATSSLSLCLVPLPQVLLHSLSVSHFPTPPHPQPCPRRTCHIARLITMKYSRAQGGPCLLYFYYVQPLFQLSSSHQGENLFIPCIPKPIQHQIQNNSKFAWFFVKTNMFHGLHQIIQLLCHSEQLASHPKRCTTLYAFIEQSLEKSLYCQCSI